MWSSLVCIVSGNLLILLRNRLLLLVSLNLLCCLLIVLEKVLCIWLNNLFFIRVLGSVV